MTNLGESERERNTYPPTHKKKGRYVDFSLIPIWGIYFIHLSSVLIQTLMKTLVNLLLLLKCQLWLKKSLEIQNIYLKNESFLFKNLSHYSNLCLIKKKKFDSCTKVWSFFFLMHYQQVITSPCLWRRCLLYIFLLPDDTLS